MDLVKEIIVDYAYTPTLPKIMKLVQMRKEALNSMVSAEDINANTAQQIAEMGLGPHVRYLAVLFSKHFKD